LKQLQGSASAEIELSVEDCFAMLASIERYPAWFEVVREAEILERGRDGRPRLVRVALHVPQSPFGTEFAFTVAVEADRPEAMQFTKLPDGPADQDRLELTWRLRENGSTEIEFEFDAAVSFVPAYLPLGGAGDVIAEAILDAATTAFAESEGEG
jgi:ribosome-associated toxin RatA of RatAB toxin-antitoxin module